MVASELEGIKCTGKMTIPEESDKDDLEGRRPPEEKNSFENLTGRKENVENLGENLSDPSDEKVITERKNKFNVENMRRHEPGMKLGLKIQKREEIFKSGKFLEEERSKKTDQKNLRKNVVNKLKENFEKNEEKKEKRKEKEMSQQLDQTRILTDKNSLAKDMHQTGLPKRKNSECESRTRIVNLKRKGDTEFAVAIKSGSKCISKIQTPKKTKKSNFLKNFVKVQDKVTLGGTSPLCLQDCMDLTSPQLTTDMLADQWNHRGEILGKKQIFVIGQQLSGNWNRTNQDKGHKIGPKFESQATKGDNL